MFVVMQCKTDSMRGDERKHELQRTKSTGAEERREESKRRAHNRRFTSLFLFFLIVSNCSRGP